MNLLLGILGGAVGGWVFGLLGIHIEPGILGELITSVAGAVICLWIWNKVS